jgi:hypothetical protein
MPAEFDKWWDDTKKHYKRLHYWLPHAKELKSRVSNARTFRYFTLCARSMIDVFMLAQEGVLVYDSKQGVVMHVRFCESDSEQFPEINELIGIENAGFFGKLENLVLFQDDDFTAQYPTLESIDEALADEGLIVEKRETLQTKRTNLYVKASFPYDFINLDFCGYYYPKPPDILKINRTVDKFLDWQRQYGSGDIGGQKIQVNDFLLSVTCRHDKDFPHEAEKRLEELVKTNCKTHSDYKKYLEENRCVSDLNAWIQQARDDFFLSTWPKEISRIANQYQWAMKILGYVHYDRVNEENQPYKITCLMCRFTRISNDPNYLEVALYALDQSKRKFISDIGKETKTGRDLLENLAGIVKLRNQQAERKRRPLLPMPL